MQHKEPIWKAPMVTLEAVCCMRPAARTRTSRSHVMAPGAAAGGGRRAGRASMFALARNCGSPGPVSAVASDSRTAMMRRASACRGSPQQASVGNLGLAEGAAAGLCAQLLTHLLSKAMARCSRGGPAG